MVVDVKENEEEWTQNKPQQIQPIAGDDDNDAMDVDRNPNDPARTANDSPSSSRSSP